MTQSILDYWMAHQKSLKMTVVDAMAELSADIGTTYRPTRYYEWRKGSRPLPESVHRYMLECMLPIILYRHGIHMMPDLDDEQAWKSLAAAVMPPAKPETKD